MKYTVEALQREEMRAAREMVYGRPKKSGFIRPTHIPPRARHEAESLMWMLPGPTIDRLRAMTNLDLPPNIK